MRTFAFRLDSGRPSLDLVATLGRRHADPVERMTSAAAAAAWLTAAGVLPADAPIRVSERHLANLRQLREVTNRLVRAAIVSASVDDTDLAVLNRIAAGPALHLVLLGPGAGSIDWGDADPVDAAIASVARDAIALLAGDMQRIRECGNPDCSLLFYDESQSRRRRWCSMQRCGNLAKIHAYRRRGSQLLAVADDGDE